MSHLQVGQMYAHLASPSRQKLPCLPMLATRAPGPVRAQFESKGKGSHRRREQGQQSKAAPARKPRPTQLTGRGQQSKAAPARNEPAIGGPKQTVTQWLEDMRQESLLGVTWKTGRLFVDLFSGKNCPVGKDVRARGGAVIAFDLLIDARFDLSQPEVEQTLMRWIRQGLVWAVFLGTDCTTWSSASYSKGPGWFNSYRSRGNLWGQLASLSPKAQEKVLQGNGHVRFTIRVLQEIADQPSAVGGLENPKGSVMWMLPELQALEKRSRTYHTICHYCQYGTQWKKPTRLFFVGGRKALAPSKLCKQVSGRCSRTKKPHLKLGKGRCHPSSGAVLTKLATEYPRRLATQIVDCLAG